MPLTFLRYFSIGSTLRWVMSTTPWPDHPLYHEMVAVFRNTFGDALRSTKITDVLPTTAEDRPSWAIDPLQVKPLPGDVYAALLNVINTSSPSRFSHIEEAPSTTCLPYLPNKGQFVRTIRHKNLIYSVPGRGTRNSFVFFRTLASGAPISPTILAGQISTIFIHSRVEQNEVKTEVFVVVQSYVPLSKAHSMHDPWREYPELNTKLYYNEYAPTHDLIPYHNIVTHAAAFVYTPEGVPRECIIMKSLDRVSHFTTTVHLPG